MIPLNTSKRPHPAEFAAVQVGDMIDAWFDDIEGDTPNVVDDNADDEVAGPDTAAADSAVRKGEKEEGREGELEMYGDETQIEIRLENNVEKGWKLRGRKL